MGQRAIPSLRMNSRGHLVDVLPTRAARTREGLLDLPLIDRDALGHEKFLPSRLALPSKRFVGRTRGALLPNICARWDLALDGLTTLGASFIAISAVKLELAVERIRNPYAGSRGALFQGIRLHLREEPVSDPAKWPKRAASTWICA